MKGKLIYQKKDKELINSVEGWFVISEDSSKNYEVSEQTFEKIKSGKYHVKDGDEVEYVLKTTRQIMHDDIFHKVSADILLVQKKISRVFLIDIDGTICDDIKNEDSHVYPTANHYPNALDIINKWYDEGNIITFFTARESKDREVTESWLKEKGFKYHGLVMDKPRIKDDQEYVWIDNRKVRAITYLGTWSELKEVDAKIQTFE